MKCSIVEEFAFGKKGYSIATEDNYLLSTLYKTKKQTREYIKQKGWKEVGGEL